MKRVFIVAMECEAAAVRPTLRPGDELIVCGIGKVNAAAATMRAICGGADEIVNAGLCGGLDPAMAIGEVYEVDAAVEYDFDLAQLNGTCVGQKDERSSPYIPVRTSGKLPVRKLATGDHFSDDESDIAYLRSLGLTLRDMEGAAVADVCDKAEVACRLVKSVCDVQGQGPMTGQYLAARARVLERLQAAMQKMI